jgi:hypothetical protein
MTLESEWTIRVKTAAEAIENSPGAPDWLKLALLDALAVAEDLEPQPEPAPVPPTFFYPH